jgi:Beta-ketoacyl synthase, N-terminal domain
MIAATRAPAPRIAGTGMLTGWGEGPAAVPAGLPAIPPALLTAPTPVLEGERFRRATRECLLAVAAVRAAAADAGRDRRALAGARTGVLYASATAYAAANRAFLEDEGSATLHFPYTAPSAVPGEVTIEFGIQGPYVNLMGGAPATLHALWYAARWLAEGAADRVLVLAAESLHEVWDLFGRARRLYRRPVVEGAVCVLLEPGPGDELTWASSGYTAGGAAASVGAVIEAVLGGRTPEMVAGAASHEAGRAERALFARQSSRAMPVGSPGEALAGAPLIGLACARARAGEGCLLLSGAWRNEYAAMLWPSLS